MNKESLYKISKMNNLEKIVLVKFGNFYKTFDEDAKILWSLFGYRIIEDRISFPLSVFNTVISKLTRLGLSIIVINNENDINNYITTGENTYDKIKEEAYQKYETDGKVNQIKILVEDKIKSSFINYDKLLEFINTL